MTIPIEKIREAFEDFCTSESPARQTRGFQMVILAIAELEAARKEIEIFKGANEHLRETEAALLQVIRDLREDVQRKDGLLHELREEIKRRIARLEHDLPYTGKGSEIGEQLLAQSIQMLRDAISPVLGALSKGGSHE